MVPFWVCILLCLIIAQFVVIFYQRKRNSDLLNKQLVDILGNIRWWASFLSKIKYSELCNYNQIVLATTGYDAEQVLKAPADEQFKMAQEAIGIRR